MSVSVNQFARILEIEKDATYREIQIIKKKEIIRELTKVRGALLDSAQFFFGKEPQWNIFRSRVLTILGKNGFEQAISETIEKPLIQNGDV